MNIPSIFWIVPAASVVALSFAWAFYRLMKREDEGTPRMREIAAHVRKGAMAYLRQQYKVVGIVFAVLALFFAWLAYGAGVQNGWVPFAFITGGFFSGLAGYFGMKTATYASARTANAARQSLDRGLKVAFRSGAVMGLVVVGLGLLDISFWYVILNHFVEVAGPQKLVVITTTMLTFGMGASTQALFARVGGGIYTKAADVGADLVGKVEAGIPEDDPRNPATIADNVGDNVGDVAGMGADLYESYCGSILATAALGAAAFSSAGSEALQIKAVMAPMLIAAVGILLSILGIFLVRTKEGATMRELLRSLGVGVNFSSLLIAAATFGILCLLGVENWVGLSFSVITGLVAGIVIGQATEYFTSHSYKPTQKIAGSAQTGPATVIIAGIGSGMISTAIPVVTIGVAIILAYLCAIGFDIENMMAPQNMSMGLYGIGIAAVGMLSTLGITLATDAYGPIADNAGGNAGAVNGGNAFQNAGGNDPDYMTFKVKKHLYRNVNNKVFGGVISGLATYLGWDATIMRILVVVLALCTHLWPAFVIYMILWMVIPPANTPLRVLNMQGAPVTVDNIGQSVLSSTPPPYQGVPAQQSGSSNFFATIVSVAAKCIMALIGMFSSMAALGLFVAFMAVLTGMIAYVATGSEVILQNLDFQMYDSVVLGCSTVLCALMMLMIPCVALTWLACCMLFKAPSASKTVLITGIVLEVIFIAATVVLGTIVGANLCQFL